MTQYTRAQAMRAARQDGADSGETVRVAISSELPCERWFGVEILSHAPDAVDLSRLADGRHPLLLNHDTYLQIGVVESAALDVADKVLRGEVRFSRAPLGQEIAQDVADGIRSLISVGYRIDEIVEEKRAADGTVRHRTLTGDDFVREMTSSYGDHFHRSGPAACRARGEEPDTYIVTRWTPFEVSVVPVPADPSVGVGRSAGEAVAPQPQVATRAGEARPRAAVNPSSTITSPEIRVMTDTTQQPTGAELERARSSEIIALGQQYAKYLGPNDAAEAVRTGKSVDQFRDAILAKVYARHETTQDVQLDMPKADAKRYSLGRALLASVTGDWSQAGLEREASAACAKLYGRTPEGFYVPFDVFKRDFNVGTATEAGNLVPTDLRTDLYVDALRNAMVLGRMNARILTGLTSSIDIPRKTTPSTVGFLTEIGSAAETNPVTTKVTLQPHRIGGYVEVSKQALIQSAMALEPMLRDDLITSAALQFEARALVGTGTAASDTDLRSLLSGTGWTGLGTVTEAGNGTSMGWSEIVALETAVATANAEPDTLAGYVINTRTRGKAKTTQRGTNLAFCWDNGAQPLNGYRAGVSNAVPSNLTKGTSTTICSAALFASDWSMLVLATFGGLDVTVDPYTKADTGQVKITLNQFVDLGVRQPAAFAYRKDLLTT